MILITTEEWIGLASIYISSCVASFCFGGGLGFMQGIKMAKNPKPAIKPYPLKGMFKHFSVIEDKIKSCNNTSDWEDVRLDLFAFAETYTDSGSFVRELQELLNEKEIEIVGAYNIV